MTEIQLASHERDLGLDRSGAKPPRAKESTSAFAGELRTTLDRAPSPKIVRSKESIKKGDNGASMPAPADAVVTSESANTMRVGTNQAGNSDDPERALEGEPATISRNGGASSASELEGVAEGDSAARGSAASRVETGSDAVGDLVEGADADVQPSASAAEETTDGAAESSGAELDSEIWVPEDGEEIGSSMAEGESSEAAGGAIDDVDVAGEESAALDAEPVAKVSTPKGPQTTGTQVPQQAQRLAAPDGTPQLRSAAQPEGAAPGSAESVDERMETYTRMSGNRARVVIGEGQNRIGVSVLVRAGAAEVSITAANSQEAQALARSSGQLAEALKAQGLALDLSTFSQSKKQEKEEQDSKSAPQPKADLSSSISLHGVRVIA